MKPVDYATTDPEFDLFTFFEGEQQAWGIFIDRFGKLRKRFQVSIKGSIEKDLLTLDESFIYDDSTTEERTWLIKRIDKHQYVGSANEIVGKAQGESYGSALQWQYQMDLNIDGTDWRVHFNDWMFLLDQNTMVNKAVVTKLGVKLGEVILFFRKE
jgi:hypothetical protein